MASYFVKINGFAITVMGITVMAITIARIQLYLEPTKFYFQQLAELFAHLDRLTSTGSVSK